MTEREQQTTGDVKMLSVRKTIKKRKTHVKQKKLAAGAKAMELV